MSQSLNSAVAVIGIDIGKNSFHVVGLNQRGAEFRVKSRAAIMHSAVSNDRGASLSLK
jgi:Tfp pilus assembly PilM family ATPase